MTDSFPRRRSLTHVGGAIETAGDATDAKALAHALEVSPSSEGESGSFDNQTRTHIHGFHTYPARMHPVTASRLVEAFCPAGGRILDPFCGSGTVLVEAMILGRTALGVDLNPLAVLLSSCKTKSRTPQQLAEMVAEAAQCAALADDRRRARTKPTRRYPRLDALLFEPHVLMELDSLRLGVHERRKTPVGPDLALILSSILIKCSNRVGDTSNNTTPRKLAPGFPAKHFFLKAEEWAHRLDDVATLLPRTHEHVATLLPSTPEHVATLLPRNPEHGATVLQGDATKLAMLPLDPVDAIVTSPPYAATYDYFEHHDVRLRWLGMDAVTFQRGELGSRTAYQKLYPNSAKRLWSQELGQFLVSAGGLLKKGAPLVLVIADSSVANVALRADEIVAEIARGCGFHPSAKASQVRPHFHGPGQEAFLQRPRAEHAIALRKMK